MNTKFNRITINPKVCMGQPTFRGLRITVAFVLKLMASGMSNKDILESYPELEEGDLTQAIQYAAWLAEDNYKSVVAPFEELNEA